MDLKSNKDDTEYLRLTHSYVYALIVVFML